MPRSPRVRFPGAVSHVMSRGNEQRAIYSDNTDRRRFLRILEEAVGRYNVICHAHVLMDNHYHLVVETPDPNLSQAMQYLNSTYAQAFNRRHARVGHLFQGRFKETLVEKQSYFLEVCRYVVLNPVRAAIVKLPHEWPWSSFRATSGLAPAPEFLCVDWLLRCFDATDLVRARRRYVEFVLQGIGQARELDERFRRDPVLGGEAFIERYREAVEQMASQKREVTKRSRLAGRPGLANLLDGVGKKAKRDEQMRRAYERFGYAISEISRYLGLHRTTVSRAIDRDRKRQFTV